MQLSQIQKFTGQLELLSGLHIGSGDSELQIGGADNPVVKNPITRQPYIPGSSLKGKMRSLLEWRAGLVGQTEGRPLNLFHLSANKIAPEQLPGAIRILKLFGGSPYGQEDQRWLAEIGPSRLSFWDCGLDQDWVAEMSERNLLLTETKLENMIDRIKGTAEHPRSTERVPAGTRFEFNLTLRIHDGEEDLIETVLIGLRLLELTGLGGSSSRGYGKIVVRQLKLDDQPMQEKMERLTLTEAA